jgi:hypothetical protein
MCMSSPDMPEIPKPIIPQKAPMVAKAPELKAAEKPSEGVATKRKGIKKLRRAKTGLQIAGSGSGATVKQG